MFCPKCGKEIVDDAVVCVHCGREVNIKIKDDAKKDKDNNVSKVGIGILFGLFLPALIGFFIGFAMYPYNTVARRTFIKGWLITFICRVVGMIAIMLITEFS